MELIRLDPKDVAAEVFARVAGVLRLGGLVGFPTETVYGIGALPGNEGAIHRIYEVKDRPHTKPLAYHIASIEEVRPFVDPIPKMGQKLIDKYWPGPLTLVFDRENQPSVGLRFPANSTAQKLIRACGSPLVATSANPSGEEPAVTGEEVVRFFGDELDVIIDTGPTELRQASTVVRIGRQCWELLREGFIDERMVRDHLCQKLLFVCTGNTCRSVMAEHLCRRLLTERLDVPEDRLEQCGYRLGSAGVLAFFGGSASTHTVDVMRSFGCDVSAHFTRPLTSEMAHEADRIFVMTQDQKRLVEALAPTVTGKVSLLSRSGQDIEDPFGRSIDCYQRVAQEIDEALRQIEEIGR